MWWSVEKAEGKKALALFLPPFLLNAPLKFKKLQLLFTTALDGGGSAPQWVNLEHSSEISLQKVSFKDSSVH